MNQTLDQRWIPNNFRVPLRLLGKLDGWEDNKNTKEIRFTGGANKHKLLFGFLADEALLRKSSVLAFQGFEVGGGDTHNSNSNRFGS